MDNYDELREKIIELGWDYDPVLEYWEHPVDPSRNVSDLSIREMCNIAPEAIGKIFQHMSFSRHSFLYYDQNNNSWIMTVDSNNYGSVKQPTVEELVTLAPGNWIKVLLTCREYTFCKIVENNPDRQMLIVQPINTDTTVDVHYVVGMRVLSGIESLALEAQ